MKFLSIEKPLAHGNSYYLLEWDEEENFMASTQLDHDDIFISSHELVERISLYKKGHSLEQILKRENK